MSRLPACKDGQNTNDGSLTLACSDVALERAGLEKLNNRHIYHMGYMLQEVKMEITDVRIKLSTKKGNRVKAFATITFDDAFVVRDLRIIEGHSGLFVAMPSRPLKDPCPKCGYRNPVRGKFCAGCGSELKIAESPKGDDKNLHRDVAHPITQEMRDYIHNRIIDAYKLEIGKSPEEPVSAPKEEKEPEVKKGLFGRKETKKETESAPKEETTSDKVEGKEPKAEKGLFGRKKAKKETEVAPKEGKKE